MGSRTRDTLNEIERLRSSLDETLTELEQRLPSMEWGKRALQLALGGGAGGSALMMIGRRALRARSKKRHRDDVVAPEVNVKVFSAGAGIAALGVAAIWAAVRIAEAKMRAEGGRRAEVRAIDGARARGAS